MRIEQLLVTNFKSAEGAQLGQKPHEVDPQVPGGPASDRADLSRLSQALSGEVEEGARLEQLRAAVASGSYQVPAAELSQRIVDFHLRGEE